MKTKDCNILQITEPQVKLRKLDFEVGDVKDPQKTWDVTSMYFMIPYINVNGYKVQVEKQLRDFELRLTGIAPHCDFTFEDTYGDFKNKYYPRDLGTFSIYIASPGDKQKYKPIHIDFIITSIFDNSDDNVGVFGEEEACTEYSLSGIINIPKLILHNSNCIEDTSFKTLLKIASDCELGFASNIESTNDKQKWLNANDDYEDYIQTITNHSYINDECFMDSFIDQFYTLNFVEVDRLFTQEGKKDEIKDTTVYSKSMFRDSADKKSDQVNDEDTTPDESSLGEKSNYEKETYYHITNSLDDIDWTDSISTFSPITNSSNSIYDGYKKYVQYYDINNQEFVSEYVDGLNHNTPGMLAINKGQIINGKVEDDLLNKLRTYTYYGSQDNDNVHKNYYWALQQNNFNIDQSSKSGLNVTLFMYNPSIQRYSRIWVDIYNQNTYTQEELKNESGDDDSKNAKIKSEVTPPDNSDSENTDSIKAVLNESLSGWYVVQDIVLSYDYPNHRLTEQLTLLRRENKPILRSDYSTDQENKKDKVTLSEQLNNNKKALNMQ